MSHYQESWFRTVTSSAVAVRRQFGVPDRVTRDRMVRAFRAALRPRQKAGRKPNQATARAADMWIAGMTHYTGARDHTSLRHHQRLLWQRIYGTIFPEFNAMDKLTRQYRTCTLRRNVKAYLRRQGYKWPKGIRVTTRIRARIRVLSPALTNPAE
jgi:hypothetical protein